MKYLDSNVFIYPLIYEDKKSKLFKKVFLELVNKRFKGITSVLTWDEVVHVIQRKKGIEESIIRGDRFLRLSNLTLIDTNKNIILLAQKIIAKYNLKPRDAIHAATALSQGCTEIISDDSDFDKVKEIKRISPDDFR